MHERSGAQLICLAAFGAVNCLASVVALGLRGSMSPPLGIFTALAVAAVWWVWFGALRGWIRGIRHRASCATHG